MAAKLFAVKRKFSIDSAIKPEDQEQYFLVPMQDNSPLLNAIFRGTFFMVLGPPGSGKTTRCRSVHTQLRQLGEFFPLWLTLQETNEDTFWEDLGHQIKNQCSKWGSHLDITDPETFLRFLVHHRKKKIVIFMDEFDRLIPHPTLSYVLCSTLLATQNKISIFGLHAVIAIGSSSIVQCSGNRPPFTTSSCWEVPSFSKKEVEDLFAQFSENRKVELEEGIVEDIFEKTNGYPAMVCFLGEKLDKKWLPTKKITLAEWKNYADNQLRNDIAFNWKFADEIEAALRVPIYQNRVAEMLVHNIQRTNRSADPVHRDLIAKRLLVTSGSTFGAPNDLTKFIIHEKLSRHPPQDLPITDGQFDVIKFIRTIRLDIRSLKNPSYKKNRTTKSDHKVKEVPREEMFRTQICAALSKALPSVYGFTISVEEKIDESRADIVVNNHSTGEKVVLEIVAYEPDGPHEGSVAEHFQRTCNIYTTIPGVTQAWVINITMRKREKKEYVWPKDLNFVKPPNVHVGIIHIYHDPGFEGPLLVSLEDSKEYIIVPQK